VHFWLKAIIIIIIEVSIDHENDVI